MAFAPVLHGAPEAYKAMSLTHTRSCRHTVSSSRQLMSHAKSVEFSMWLVNEAVHQDGAH